MASKRVAIIGGGVAGLACATYLERGGFDVLLHEADDRVGGRVRTDIVDGFKLDRGFQVHLTAYPEARYLLDYARLGLRDFLPGAKIRRGKMWTTVADPLRAPSKIFSTAVSPVASFRDKIALLELWKWCKTRDLDALLTDPTGSTVDFLGKFGMSENIIEGFFRPFYGGIFLENELTTSAKKFAFTFRMFADGVAALPAEGIEAIPRQLAANLKRTDIRTGSHVDASDVNADAVVLAMPTDDVSRWHATSAWYFAAEASPMRGEKLIALDGDDDGPVNNLCVPSDVQPSYAPDGRALVCASTVGIHEDEASVRAQLRQWFGVATDQWRLLRAVHVHKALPAQPDDRMTPVAKPVRRDDVYVCGDSHDTASLNGALASGRRAAQAVMADLGGAA
ncbi:MAG: NAD(P)/FAD-dependent oxidoreductase [Planctomycetota bacterium]